MISFKTTLVVASLLVVFLSTCSAACPKEEAVIEYPTFTKSDIVQAIERQAAEIEQSKKMIPSTTTTQAPVEAISTEATTNVCECNRQQTVGVPRAAEATQTKPISTEHAVEPTTSTNGQTLISDKKTGKKYKVITITVPVEDDITSTQIQAEQEPSEPMLEEVEKQSQEVAEEEEQQQKQQEEEETVKVSPKKNKVSKVKGDKSKKSSKGQQMDKNEKKRSKRETKGKKSKKSSSKKNKSNKSKK